MYDETVDLFMWSFESFLQVISAKALKVIFTDQDEIMTKVILHVMSNIYHGLVI